jgi:hypothetical protein
MKYALAVSLILVGCATPKTPEPPIIRTVEVKVPVQVPCVVQLPTKPVWELDRTPPDSGIFDLAKAAVIEIKQRIQYQIVLEAAAKSCS